MPSADAPSLAVAATAAKACLPRPRHIGRTASGATFQVCRSLSGPVDREARSFASVIGAPRAPYHPQTAALRGLSSRTLVRASVISPLVGATTVWRVLSLSGVSCPSPRACFAGRLPTARTPRRPRWPGRFEAEGAAAAATHPDPETAPSGHDGSMTTSATDSRSVVPTPSTRAGYRLTPGAAVSSSAPRWLLSWPTQKSAAHNVVLLRFVEPVAQTDQKSSASIGRRDNGCSRRPFPRGIGKPVPIPGLTDHVLPPSLEE